MVNLMLLCLLQNLPGPPKILLDTGTHQLYPINKRLCSTFDPYRDSLFELYTRNNPNQPDILRIDDDAALNSSNINFIRPTVIFIHGYLESSTTADSVITKNYFLKAGDYNVIVVNNERLLAGPDYLTACLNVLPIGKYLASFIDYLVRHGLDLADLHIVGMSLGGHIAGVTGKNVKSGKVAWITGLDPAGPCFKDNFVTDKLSKSDAEFVEVYHTNAALFGTNGASGDVDIWFNGGYFQPGCDPVSAIRRKPGSVGELVFCNHYQAWRIYAETLLNPKKYLALKCQSYSEYRKGKCDENDRTYLGLSVNKTARGDFYIYTGTSALNVAKENNFK